VVGSREPRRCSPRGARPLRFSLTTRRRGGRASSTLSCATLAIVLCFAATVFAQPTVPGDHATQQREQTQNAIESADNAIARGLGYLVKQQGEDGGWHSTTYGALKPGVAVTTLALYGAAHAPPPLREKHSPHWRRGFEFLRAGLAKHGRVANADGTLDYPTYGAALLLVAIERLKLPATAAERAKLIDYLLRSQLDERRGFEKGNVHRGGWDLLGDEQPPGKTTGSNISLTCCVMEALAGVAAEKTSKARSLAAEWAIGCQDTTADGGFAFTPDGRSPLNKAGWSDAKNSRPRSYGTATCDGLRLLAACGKLIDDKRLAAARDWLVKHRELSRVPGIPATDGETGWDRSLRFYYYATLGRSLGMLPRATARRRALGLIKLLAEQQQRDGHWASASHRMREDDPLIATPLALVSLSEARRVLAKDR